MRTLVTGSGGFIGAHLITHLLDSGVEVHAFDPAAPHVPGHPNLHVHQGSILDPEGLQAVLKTADPSAVYHLAAQSYPGVSWDQPVETFDVNLCGTVNLLDGLRALEMNPVVLVTCSSAEYAPGKEGQPIHEDAPKAPSSPYGVSKLAQDHLCQLYAERYGMKTVRVRPFFITGPGKQGDVSSDFARRVVGAERGELDEFPVGNLDIIRDFLDVRDAVAAFRLLEEQGGHGEVYNICSGKGYRIGDILEVMRRLSKVELKEKVNPDLLRPVDEMVKIGDPSRLMSLGWAPAVSFEQSLEDILNYWREK